MKTLIKEQSFKKAAKKMLNQLTQTNDELKLSTIQEMMAKSFGFHSFFELQKSWVQETDKKTLLEVIDSEQLAKLMSKYGTK